MRFLCSVDNDCFVDVCYDRDTEEDLTNSQKAGERKENVEGEQYNSVCHKHPS